MAIKKYLIVLATSQITYLFFCSRLKALAKWNSMVPKLFWLDNAFSFYNGFWSLDEVVGDLRIHVHPYVRTYGCTSVTLLLENRSLIFPETLQLVRAWKCKKNVPSAFLKKIPVLPILAKNSPKLAILAQNAQKWRFFAFFRNPCIIFFWNFAVN